MERPQSRKFGQVHGGPDRPQHVGKSSRGSQGPTRGPKRSKGGPGKSSKKGQQQAFFKSPAAIKRDAKLRSEAVYTQPAGVAGSNSAFSLSKGSKFEKGTDGIPTPVNVFPMRINKYLSHYHKITRKMADELIEKKQVKINGKIAVLGDKVLEKDKVDLAPKELANMQKDYMYFAYNKPVGIVTHSPEKDELDIKQMLLKNSSLAPHITKSLFPIGRLDKKSQGLILLTNDGRVTDRLLNPEYVHDKEYIVTTVQDLPNFFQRIMENGIQIGDYLTRPCKVKILGDKSFSIILTEGKHHQIRRMCEALRVDVKELKRTRVMNIQLGKIPSGQTRRIEGEELDVLMKGLGLL